MGLKLRGISLSCNCPSSKDLTLSRNISSKGRLSLTGLSTMSKGLRPGSKKFSRILNSRNISSKALRLSIMSKFCSNKSRFRLQLQCPPRCKPCRG